MISIIITTFNRPSTLTLVLEALNNQSINKTKFEIIVVEGDKTLPSAEIVDKSTLNIKYLYEPLPGVTPARHRGAKEANGDILVYLEDDGIASPLWLESISNAFKNDPKIAMVGGKNLPRYESIPPSWINELWEENKNGKMLCQLTLIDLGSKDKYIPANYVWALNLAIKKEILYEVGGFNPDLSPKKYEFYQGDGETGLSHKIEESGYKAFYAANAIVEHIITKDRFTLEYFYKRNYFQGICDSYTTIRKYKKFSNLEDREVKKVKISSDDSMLKQVKGIMCNAALDGYIAHQKAVKQNNKLFNWILKKDYFTYDI